MVETKPEYQNKLSLPSTISRLARPHLRFVLTLQSKKTAERHTNSTAIEQYMAVQDREGLMVQLQGGDKGVCFLWGNRCIFGDGLDV